MDLKRDMAVVVAVLVLNLVCMSSGNVVLNVQHKFAGRQRSLTALRDHDSQRHRRILSAIDLPLGSNADSILYFTKIGLGNPSKDYFVQVDTGSDLSWVNCADCDNCPKESSMVVKQLTPFDPKSSSSSSVVNCDDPFCSSIYGGKVNSGCTKGKPCKYSLGYGDGSRTAGYYVKDNMVLDQVTGNAQRAHTNGPIIIGCSAHQSGLLETSKEVVDGLIGFGQANSSLISQLAAAGKVKKMFAHCLNGDRGGGIFAIGEVVSPKVRTTPIVPNKTHYNVVMKNIEIGGKVLELLSDLFRAGYQGGTVIDSGSTLAYFPDVIYEALILNISSYQPGIKLSRGNCFSFSTNVDDAFPTVKIEFEDDLTLTVHPHDYLIQQPVSIEIPLTEDDSWCFGWQNSGVQKEFGRDLTLLGDMVLSNKLVFYDLENQGIGWTEYNCSSSIKLKDEKTGAVHAVGAHNISLASRLIDKGIATYLLMLIFLQLGA